MVLYATERIEDAVSLTRSLLFPFQVGLWARLAVVVFFLGMGSGGGSTASSVWNVPSSASAAPGAGVNVDVPNISISADVLTLLVVGVLVVVAVGLVFAWIGATMEFVFVESLSAQTVAIRRGFARHRGRGLRLFGFRIGLFLVGAVVLGGLALLLFGGPITTLLSGGDPTVSGSALVVGGGVLLLAGVVLGVPLFVAHGLTTEFVVPIMLATDCGILAGWSRLWTTIKSEWKQYLVYIVVAIGLRLATAAAAGIVVGIIGFVVAIPFVIVGLVLGYGAVVSGTVTTGVLVGVVLLAVAFGLTLTLLSAVVYVPIQSFHRYFALLFIGDVERDFDVISELRPPLADGFEPSSRG